MVKEVGGDCAPVRRKLPGLVPHNTRAAGQIVGHNARADRADDQLQIGVSINVRQCRRAKHTVPCVCVGRARRWERDLLEQVALPIGHYDLADAPAAVARSGAEDYLGLAIAVEVVHYRLGCERHVAGQLSDVERPAAMLGFIHQ